MNRNEIKNLNVIDGKTYEYFEFTEQDVARNVLPAYFGVGIKYITYEQLSVVTRMLNHKWVLIPGFYGDKTSEGVMLKPNVGWFSLSVRDVDNKDIIYQYTAYINFNKLEILLYNSERLIATFYNIEDLFDYMPHLYNGYPVVCVGYYDDKVSKNVMDFMDVDTQFDGINFYPNKLVYNDIDVKNFEFVIDESVIKKVEFTDIENE